MNTIQIGETQIGDKTFRSSELFSAGYPTSEQMTTFCSTLGPLIENGVPLLKALSLTAVSSQHPWLRVILAGAACKIREGGMIVDGVVWSLIQMYTHRLAELNSKQAPSSDWRSNPSAEFSIPDFFGFFNDLVSLVCVGEETGELDTVLNEHLIAVYGGEDGYGKKTWGHDFSIMCRSLEVLSNAGLPSYAIARVLNELPSLIPLRDELVVFQQKIEEEDSLADAFRKSGTRLSNSQFCGLVAASEEMGRGLSLRLLR